MGTTPRRLTDVTTGVRQSRLRLLAPLRYLMIHHPEKAKFDLWYPLAFAVVGIAAHVALFPDLSFFGDGGLLKFARDLLIMAVPFLVGALASVAMGLPGNHIDKRPIGADLLLDERKLTLRQFVCYLLGYLSFLGILTLGVSVAADLVRPTIAIWLAGAPSAAPVILKAMAFGYFALLSTFTITLLWALYFLTDIVNRPAVEDDI